jgi:hypothetical protein
LPNKDKNHYHGGVNPTKIKSALEDIRATGDPLEKALKLAGLVSALFRERDWEMVIVGGSAIEFYTEGQYMSGDIDMCAKSEVAAPPPSVRAEVMGLLGATGGPRSFKLGDQWIDLLGRVERMSQAQFRVLETPFGAVNLMPVEELLVDKVFSSIFPQRNDESRECAEKLMAVCINGGVAADWTEAAKMAASKEYGIGSQFEQFRSELEKRMIPDEKRRDNLDLGGMEKHEEGPSLDI